MSLFPQNFASTVSHWQASVSSVVSYLSGTSFVSARRAHEQNRGPSSLYGHNATEPLPSHADYIIIGAGICGASLAYHLTRADAVGHGRRVVVLEAKDVASGASGRNGGHIGPASFLSFPSLIRPISQGGAGVSLEEGVKILENERETLAYAAEVITQEGLVDKVDFWKGYKYEVFTSPEGAQSSSSAYETYLQARYQSSLKEEPYEWALCTDPLEAAQKTRVSNAIAYNRGPAGSVHPHKLTTELLKIAMRSGAELYSWAPVKNLSRFGEGWEVETSRGMIKAGVVVLCTNAYTGGLFPESERGMGISAHLTPYRGHCANYTPPLSYSGPKSLDHSYVVENGMYIVSTPHSGIVAGTWAAATINHGLATRDEIYGILDDSTVLPSVEKWMKGWFERTFEGWNENGRGEGMGRLWTGIMAYSYDLLPLVGPIPNKPNLFAAVGFHGHGMARILTITRGLSQLLSTGKWDERLPTSFQITEMRLSRAKEEGKEVMGGEKWEIVRPVEEPGVGGE